MVACYTRIARDCQEFVCDEVALALSFSPTAAGKVVGQALALAAIPGMLEAIDGGLLSSHHALAVLMELDRVELSVEQRAAIGFIVLHRAGHMTPGELMKLTRTLILQVDLPAALAREEVATGKRRVSFYPTADGQAAMNVHGPVADIAAMQAALAQAKKDHPRPADRTAGQWEFDLVHRLLTGELKPGNWQASVIVPFTTATGASWSSPRSLATGRSCPPPHVSCSRTLSGRRSPSTPTAS